MEPQTPSLSPKRSSSLGDYSSNVDTSRPFRSVKEAVAVFGERLLTGELHAPKPSYVATTTSPQVIISHHDSMNPTADYDYQETPWTSADSSSPSSNKITPKEGSCTTNDDDDDADEPKADQVLMETLKKLETELEETKKELKLLKERESETEVAMATLNAELHKNKSKLAEAEAAAAKKAAANYEVVQLGKGEEIVREEAKRRELMRRMEENNQTLAEILSISGEKEAYFGGRSRSNTKKLPAPGMKKKPIVPLVGDFFFFFKKRNSSTADHLHSLYASPALYFN